jgi:hypothetical protein
MLQNYVIVPPSPGFAWRNNRRDFRPSSKAPAGSKIRRVPTTTTAWNNQRDTQFLAAVKSRTTSSWPRSFA